MQMNDLMKENCGDLNKLKELGKDKKNSYTTEQLLDENLKNIDGENRLEVTRRMEQAFESVLSKDKGKRVAIVSHGAALKFLLMKWCKLNNNNELEFNGKIITLNSPGVLELLFDDKKLVKLRQVI